MKQLYDLLKYLFTDQRDCDRLANGWPCKGERCECGGVK